MNSLKLICSRLLAMEWIMPTVPHALPTVCFVKYIFELTSYKSDE